jgi:arginase
MDLGAGRRGVDMGPSALRKAGIAAELSSLGHLVSDYGDVHAQVASDAVQDLHLKFLPEITAVCSALADAVEAALHDQQVPVVLGGDHSMSIGSLAGVSRALPPGARLGVLWIDAHADINTPASSPSGNIHGMPLAVALGKGEAGLMALRGTAPALNPAHLVYIGLRSVDRRVPGSAEPGEAERIAQLGIRAYTMREVDEMGIAAVTREALDYLCTHCDHLHVSFDLDVLDPGVAPGVGTPVPGGLSYREGHYIMETIGATGRMASLDIAEVNPILDTHNISSEVAVAMAASAFGRRIL